MQGPGKVRFPVGERKVDSDREAYLAATKNIVKETVILLDLELSEG